MFYLLQDSLESKNPARRDFLDNLNESLAVLCDQLLGTIMCFD
jgi:hypothetical protein